MERVWTPKQREAIDARGQDILVSAAAGSGKTAVLTQRIIDRITDPEDPLSLDQLLVVTYTKAAAAELRMRIRAALLDAMGREGSSRRLRRQLLLLERAEISTIHSFCLSLIRKNASLLSLPATLRVADEGEAKRIAKQAMDHLLADRYKEADGDFLELIAQFAVLGDDKIGEMLLSLYEKTTTLPEGVGYFASSARRMEESVGAGLLSSPYGQLLLGYLNAYLDHYAPFYGRLEELLPRLMAEERAEAELSDTKEQKKAEKRIASMEALRAFYAAEWEMLSALPLRTEEYTVLAAAMQDVIFGRKPALREAPEALTAASAFRDDCKKEFASLRDRFFPAGGRDTLDQDLAKTARLLWVLSELMEAFEQRFAVEKRRLGLLDYADLERYTHRLLVRDGAPTLAARAVALCYKEIYIDEYQDVNRLQDEIFSAIASNNRFMVGDIKQSIYAFRGAEPSIFADYRSRFDDASREAGQGETIYLSHNFRCDQSVVDFVNLVCRDLFTAGGAVSYQEGDALIRGKAEESDRHIPVEIALLSNSGDPSNEESLDGNAAEAAYVAAEVERLWKEEGIPLSEMALLLRSVSSRIPLYEEAFKARGIPYVHSRAMPFFEEPEVLTLLSLLYTIENPTQDVYLAGALTGPVFGITLEELIALRWQEGRPTPGECLYETLCKVRETAENPKLQFFFQWLEEYRAASCTLSSDELIRKIYADTALSAIVGADPVRGKAAEQNLRSFYQLARTYEKNSFRGLHRFLRYIGDLAAGGQGVERHAELGDDDALRILTIHQSKGLEFRVCFLADTAKDFNKRDSSAEFLFHRELGLTLTLRDGNTLCKYQTLPRQVLSQCILEGALEEEMRILYVALTRAKERLILTAWLRNPDKAKERWQRLADHFTFYGVAAAPHYIDWVMGALKAHPEEASVCCTVREVVLQGGEFSEASQSADTSIVPAEGEEVSADPAEAETVETTALEPAVLRPADPGLVAEIASRFDFVYPHAAVSDLPAKLTVSRLTPDILDDDESSPLHAPAMVTTPAFMQSAPASLTAAERGTATHVFMQFCDFEKTERSGVEAELLRLTHHRFLSPVMAEAVSIPALRTFFASPLYREMRASQRLLREFRFNVQLPAADFTKDDRRKSELSDAKLLVQGVVDCCFILPDGSLKLIDYKTDRLGKTPEEGSLLLWERYGSQLYYYKLALEKILARPVSALSLYSFHHGREFPLPEGLWDARE